MTNQEWTDELLRRTIVNEGLRLARYLDVAGNWTIGIGYNLSRGLDPLKAAGIPEPSLILAGQSDLTQPEAITLCRNDLAFAVDDARASLRKGIYDSLSDARRYVVADLCFNMGLATWLSFITTRQYIELGQDNKGDGHTASAHDYFVLAGEHLQGSAYYTQTKDRAKRNVAMLVTGEWCNANGNGTDIYPQA